jgi:hypothetical protein
MSDMFSRREALALLLGAAGALRAQSPGIQKVHLNPRDAAAIALGYHESASTVDPKEFPTYQPGQTCSNCLQLQGTPGEPWRPCNLFPGLPVSAAGWCTAWVKKA